MIHRSDDQIAKHIRNTSTQPFLNFSLCLKSFRGMFQSLKSYRFAYISVICINVIYDFVIVLVSFTSWWSSPKCQDHFDILTCCFLQQSWYGQEVAMNVCNNLLSPKSTIIINVLNVGKTVRRPLWCEISHRRSRKLLLPNNNDRWRCFPWKYHMERVYSFFPSEKCP